MNVKYIKKNIMTNKELQKWVDIKITEYKEDKVDCLEMMLYNTNQIIEQFLNSPTSQATRGVLESCMKCNKKFIAVVDSGGQVSLPERY